MNDMQRPKNVSNAVALLYITLVIDLIASLIHVFHFHHIAPKVNNALAHEAGMGYIVMFVVTFVIAWFIYFMINRGHNWARILFSLFLVISIAATLWQLHHFLHQESFVIAATAINYVLAIMATVLLYSKKANHYFCHK